MKKHYFTKIVAFLLSISVFVCCGPVLISASPASLGEPITNQDVDTGYKYEESLDFSASELVNVYHPATYNNNGSKPYEGNITTAYDKGVFSVTWPSNSNWTYDGVRHLIDVDMKTGIQEYSFVSSCNNSLKLPLFVYQDGAETKVYGLYVSNGAYLRTGTFTDTGDVSDSQYDQKYQSGAKVFPASGKATYLIQYDDIENPTSVTLTILDGESVFLNKTFTHTGILTNRLAFYVSNTTMQGFNANTGLTVKNTFSRTVTQESKDPIVEFVNNNLVLNVIKKDIVAGTFNANTYITDDYYPLVEAAEMAFDELADEALQEAIVANGFYDADKIQAIKIAKLVAEATGPVGQFVSQNVVVTQLTSVTDGDGIVNAVTEDNAEAFIRAYDQYALLENGVKNDLEFVCTDLAKKLDAAKLRAEIFTIGEFNYIPGDHTDSVQYILDATGKYIALTKKVRDTPLVTFVNSVRSDDMDEAWSNVELLRYADVATSNPSYQTLLHATPVIDGTNIVFANADNNPAALTASWFPDFPLVRFNSDSEQFVIGTVEGGQNVMKDLTYTLRWDSTTWSTPKYAVSNGTQQVSGNISYGVHGSGGALNEDQFRSIMIRVHNAYLELKSVKMEYPVLKAQILELQSLAKPELRGATLRITDTLAEQDIRFNAYFTAAEAQNYTIIAYGFLMMPADVLNGGELTRETSDAKNKEVTVMAGASVPEHFHYSTEEAELTDGFADVADLDKSFAARSYVVYKNVNSGKEHVFYSDAIERSVSQVLKSISTAVVQNTEQHTEWGWIVSSTKTETGAISVNADFSGTPVTVNTIEVALQTYSEEDKKLLLGFVLYNRIAIV